MARASSKSKASEGSAESVKAVTPAKKKPGRIRDVDKLTEEEIRIKKEKNSERISKFQKESYKMSLVKLSRNDDAELIKFLDNEGNFSGGCKQMLRYAIAKRREDILEACPDLSPKADAIRSDVIFKAELLSELRFWALVDLLPKLGTDKWWTDRKKVFTFDETADENVRVNALFDEVKKDGVKVVGKRRVYKYVYVEDVEEI